MSAVAIIPARGGSRRIPRKNIKLFHGKPIVAYSIESARESELFGELIYVSTEDDEIATIAYGYGARVLTRPTELASDEVGTQEVMRSELGYLVDQAVGKSEIDYACCIYPTAPLMTAYDINQMYELMVGQWCYGMIEGWLYWGRTDSFISRLPLMASCCSWKPARWIDINTPEDWAKAEEMYANLHVNRNVFQGSVATGFIIKP